MGKKTKKDAAEDVVIDEEDAPMEDIADSCGAMEGGDVVNEPQSDNDSEMECEDVAEVSTFIGRGDAPKPTTDYQREFLVLGQQSFINLNRINVTSSWVDSATEFPAEIEQKSLAELSTVQGLPPKLVEKVAENITHWFPVQKSVLPMMIASIIVPPVMRPRDVTIAAPTGSGKTLCFVIPCLAAVGERPSGRLAALVVAPVQTLVQQIFEEFKRFNAYDARIIALSGAVEFEKEVRKLNDNTNGQCSADIIISTPGRLVEHLTHSKNTVSLDSLRLLVVDEADRMGTVRTQWLELVERRSGGLTRVGSLNDILQSRSAPRKMLLSATLSKDVEELHAWNLHRPCLFKATVTKSTEVEDTSGMDHVTGRLSLPASIQHTMLTAETAIHPLTIYQEIEKHPEWKRILVFTNHRVSSLRLSILLSILAGEKYRVDQLTADLFGNRRAKVLKRFKSGTARVLICSDVLSRGVDIPDIDCVVNYDLPKTDRLFVHRGGRTGRAGKAGSVLSIGDKAEKRIFMAILRTNGLWLSNSEERTVTEEDLEPQMESYKAALAELQNRVEINGSGVKKEEPDDDEENQAENGAADSEKVPRKKAKVVAGKQNNNIRHQPGGPKRSVSGFEYRKKRFAKRMETEEEFKKRKAANKKDKR